MMALRNKLPFLYILIVILVAVLAAIKLPNGLVLVVFFTLFAITFWAAAALQNIIARGASARFRVCAGIITFAGLLVPTSLLPDHALGLPQPLGTLASAIIFILPSLGIILVNLLFQTGINFYVLWKDAGASENADQQTVHHPSGGAILFIFTLAFLLLAKILYNVYWLIVWDSTYDPLDFLWLIVPMFAATTAALASIISLLGISRSAGSEKITSTGAVFTLLIPGLLIAAYGAAKQVDFRQLTVERAARIDQAVEAFHARQGVYPQNLGQLTPWYMLAIPAPVIINGASWCYDGGDGYYRLGYIYREHWSAPLITGRLFNSQGDVANLPPLCEREIAQLKNRNPDFWLRGN